MYKKCGALVVLLILMAVPVTARITGYQTAEQTKEIPVAAGWNLVAFPKITIKSTALGDVQPVIYQFKDIKWERFTAQQFEPNIAYFMDFAQSGKVKVPITTSQPNIQLKQGWNAIGVSVDVKIKEGKIKSTGQEYALKNKVTALYVFNAEQQKWSPVTINDDVSFVPGKGYLLYATQAGELTFEKEAPTITFTGDDFEDGDYTKNPEWNVINLSGQQEKEVSKGWLYGKNVEYTVPSTQAFGTWSFKYIPVIGPYSRTPRVYFIASQQEMVQTSSQKKGYYLKLDSPPQLVKVSGNQEETITLNRIGQSAITREDAQVGGFPPPSAFMVKIAREQNGRFIVETISGKYEGNDNSIQDSSYFVVTGIPISPPITGTTSIPFYIDDIKLGKICESGTKSCDDRDFKKIQLCVNEEWKVETTCTEQEACNPKTNTCEQIKFTGDDFEDGDYTKSPTWTAITYGQGATLTVNHNKMLVGINGVVASVSSTQKEGVWEFQFWPEYNGKMKIYFVASKPNMVQESVREGYYFYADDTGQRIIGRTKNNVDVPIISTTVTTGKLALWSAKIIKDPSSNKFILVLQSGLTKPMIFIGEEKEPAITSSAFFVIIGDGSGGFTIDNIKLAATVEQCTLGWTKCDKDKWQNEYLQSCYEIKETPLKISAKESCEKGCATYEGKSYCKDCRFGDAFSCDATKTKKRTCTEQGKFKEELCPLGCDDFGDPRYMGASCKCKEGESSCPSKTVIRCTNGRIKEEECAFGCGKDSAGYFCKCNVGEKACRNGQPVLCNKNGKFDPYPCDGNTLLVCSDYPYQDLINYGTSRKCDLGCAAEGNKGYCKCKANEELQPYCEEGKEVREGITYIIYSAVQKICSKEGKWIDKTREKCSSPKFCEAGFCKLPVVCSPGKSECNINLMRTCNSNGQWGSWQKCSVPKNANGQYCGYYGCDDNKGKHYDKCITSC